MEGEIDHIVQTAIRRERKVWVMTLVLMMIGMQFIHLQTTVRPSFSGPEVSKYTTSLQEMPSLRRRRLMEASSPTGESMLARAPAAEQMEALIEEKETEEQAEILNQPRAEPMNCSCPPGPRGPAVRATCELKLSVCQNTKRTDMPNNNAILCRVNQLQSSCLQYSPGIQNARH